MITLLRIEDDTPRLSNLLAQIRDSRNLTLKIPILRGYFQLARTVDKKTAPRAETAAYNFGATKPTMSTL